MPTSGAASPLPVIVGVAYLRGVKATLRDAATVRLPFGPLPAVANRPGSVSSLRSLGTPGLAAAGRGRLGAEELVVPRPVTAADAHHGLRAARQARRARLGRPKNRPALGGRPGGGQR